MNSASLCSLAGRYENPIPPRCLAPIHFLKIPALVLGMGEGQLGTELSSSQKNRSGYGERDQRTRSTLSVSSRTRSSYSFYSCVRIIGSLFNLFFISGSGCDVWSYAGSSANAHPHIRRYKSYFNSGPVLNIIFAVIFKSTKSLTAF
jgi:hypothetical protein